MIRAESLHDHCFAHAAVAVDRNRGHAGRARMGDDPVQHVKRELGPWVRHPTLAQDGADTTLVRLLQEFVGTRREVRDRSWSSVKNPNAVVWQGFKAGSAYSFSPAFAAHSAKSLRFRALAYELSSVSARFMIACSSA